MVSYRTLYPHDDAGALVRTEGSTSATERGAQQIGTGTRMVQKIPYPGLWYYP